MAVRPNEPLPEGWKEKFNVVTGKVCVCVCGVGDAAAMRVVGILILLTKMSVVLKARR